MKAGPELTDTSKEAASGLRLTWLHIPAVSHTSLTTRDKAPLALEVPAVVLARVCPPQSPTSSGVLLNEDSFVCYVTPTTDLSHLHTEGWNTHPLPRPPFQPPPPPHPHPQDCLEPWGTTNRKHQDTEVWCTLRNHEATVTFTRYHMRQKQTENNITLDSLCLLVLTVRPHGWCGA